MKINQNMMAVISNKQLLRTENNLADSMERLASGLKINHAKDNPAGIAISNKMQAQIDALDRASRNASDGVSVLQIADGALNEVTSILQRMRELSVQAASDTNCQGDKEAIQKEIESLKEEVDRISTDTEYNQKSLLDGTLDTRVYAKNVTRLSISDTVKPGDYKVQITDAATKTTTESGTVTDYLDDTTQIGVSGSISINGSQVSIEATDTYAQVYEKIRDAAEIGEATAELTNNNGTLTFVSSRYGAGTSVEVLLESKDDRDAFVAALGFTGKGSVVDEKFLVDIASEGEDAKVTLGDGFSATATVATSGNRVTVTDYNGFSVGFLTDENYAGDVTVEVSDIGTMTLQVGANERQQTDVRIQEVSTKSLYIDEVNVTTVTGASRAIGSLDDAIAQVSSIRSKIGAYENRLDYSVSSLDETGENITAALSRIQDLDMADEMTNYTKYNVLDQAAISVLTQANDIPQQVLQLLQ